MKNTPLTLGPLLLSAALAMGCGDTTSDTVAGPCDQPQAFCATFQLPEGAPTAYRELAVMGYSSLPAEGPPEVGLISIPSPEVAPDGTIRVEAELDPYRGAYYLWVLLYSAESTGIIPVAELDLIGGTDELVELSGEPIVLDPIPLQIFGR